MYYTILSFIIGLGAAIQIKFVATAAISELICVLILFVNTGTLLIKNNEINKITIFGLLWIVGILLSDFINDRSIIDTQRAVGAVFLLLVSINIAFSILRRKPNLIIFYGLGLAISNVLQYKFFPSSVVQSLLEIGFPAEQISDIYFIINFFPLAIWLSGIAWYSNNRIMSLIILASYAIISLSYDRRSIFLVLVLGFFYLLAIFKDQSNQLLFGNFKKNKKNILKIIFILIGFFVAVQTYEYAASQGMLGDGAINKYEIQSKNEVFGLASGRLDFFEGIYGAVERPFFGYGSYASDSTGIRQRFAQAIGLPSPMGITEGLPGHSHIIGAWLFAGMLSLPFWIYSIKLLLTFVIRANELDRKLIGYSLLAVLYSIWNIMFSPFANRIELGFVIAFVIVQLNAYKLKRNLDANSKNVIA